MEDVTFTISPLLKLDDYPISSRVITTNLENNKTINPDYSSALIKTNLIFKEKYCRNNIYSNNIDLYLKRRQQIHFNTFVINSEDIHSLILSSIKRELVIYSSMSLDALYIIKLLLNHGKKVVLGGAFVFIYDSETIRKILVDLGTDLDKLKNIIIVKGYVDLTTDFSEIIKNWKDVEIKNNRLSTIYECEKDYLLNYSQILKTHRIFPRLLISFNQICPYLKCRYCNHKYLPDVKFIEESDKVIDNINSLKYKYNNDFIFITDSYFHFTPDVRYILDNLKGYKFSIFTGISQLKKRDTIEYINKYIDTITVGMESTIDFALSYVKKGYLYQDILDAIDNVIKYMDRDKNIFFNVIIDLPMDSIENCLLNFKRLKDIKERFISEGFINFHFNPHALKIDSCWNMIDNSFIRRSNIPLAGENFALNYIENYPFLPDYIDVNFSRYDINGKQIPSDFELEDFTFLLD